MPPAIELHTPALPLGYRLPFLVVGLPFLAFGLLACIRTASALLSAVTGAPAGGPISLGIIALSLCFTIIGGRFTWAFFTPAVTLHLDAASRTLTHIRKYPFGITRTARHPLTKMPPPRPVWTKDSDATGSGYWSLRFTLPSGRHIDHVPTRGPLPEQEAQITRLRQDIARLMH